MRKIDLNNFQVATSETARDINSRIMLNLVRKHQPLSRADLMRYSGLQRSTISVITEELISTRWLREGAVGPALRGRRPTFLHLNEDRAGIFGINIQPGTTDVALANLSGRFLAQESISTPSSPEKLVNQVSQRIRELRREYPQMACEEIGVSLPGRVDLSSQKFVFAPNLGWQEIDLKSQLENATGLSVNLENAANACALSEFWFGKHAEEVQNLIVVTVSEGIGVGMILNGQMVRGTSGLAGEFGHVAINENGPKCGCGNHGCLEQYASATAIFRSQWENQWPETACGRNFRRPFAVGGTGRPLGVGGIKPHGPLFGEGHHHAHGRVGAGRYRGGRRHCACLGQGGANCCGRRQRAFIHARCHENHGERVDATTTFARHHRAGFTKTFWSADHRMNPQTHFICRFCFKSN